MRDKYSGLQIGIHWLVFLLVVFVGVAISFYTMLLRKTALACLLFAVAIGAAGWSFA